MPRPLGELAALMAEMSAALEPISWGGRGKYRCPACGSDQVARECLTTTRYFGAYADTARTIRCMDCGTASDE